MATTLGSASGVRRIIGKDITSLSDPDAEAYLNEAVRKIQAKYYNGFMCDKWHVGSIMNTGAANRVYETYFPIKTGTEANVKVYVRDVILTQTTDYTLSISDSTITLNNSYALSHSDPVHIFYIPAFFDDYANYMAAKRIVDTGMVDMANASASPIYNNIRFTLQEYEQMVARKPHVAKFKDHEETESVW